MVRSPGEFRHVCEQEYAKDTICQLAPLSSIEGSHRSFLNASKGYYIVGSSDVPIFRFSKI